MFFNIINNGEGFGVISASSFSDYIFNVGEPQYFSSLDDLNSFFSNFFNLSYEPDDDKYIVKFASLPSDIFSFSKFYKIDFFVNDEFLISFDFTQENSNYDFLYSVSSFTFLLFLFEFGSSIILIPSSFNSGSASSFSFDVDALADAIFSRISQYKYIETSLNGSNGAKFKDGDIVKIKGFFSTYKVLASQYVVNNDNVGTIIYKVEDINSGSIHYVPQVFLIPSSSSGGD